MPEVGSEAMNRRTGGFRYRVAGVFRRTLVLQLEFERPPSLENIGWPSRFQPVRYWRDATPEDLTTVAGAEGQHPAPIPGPTWSETRPAPPPARDA